MKYRAFANGQEITDFPISGTDTNAIYGGDTLLWKKVKKGLFDKSLYMKLAYDHTSGLSTGSNPYFKYDEVGFYFPYMEDYITLQYYKPDEIEKVAFTYYDKKETDSSGKSVYYRLFNVGCKVKEVDPNKRLYIAEYHAYKGQYVHSSQINIQDSPLPVSQQNKNTLIIDSDNIYSIDGIYDWMTWDDGHGSWGPIYGDEWAQRAKETGVTNGAYLAENLTAMKEYLCS
jgi:hypothetical protein